MKITTHEFLFNWRLDGRNYLVKRFHQTAVVARREIEQRMKVLRWFSEEDAPKTFMECPSSQVV